MTSAAIVKSPPPVELFFAFPDGVYDHVCSECTALCCKGHGPGGSLEREMFIPCARYPQLETMTVGRDGDVITFATTGSGCILLEVLPYAAARSEEGFWEKETDETFASL